jgi:cytidylate kinase
VARSEIAARDVQDSTRALAPLRKADDAIVIDTTALSVEQVVARMQETVERRRGSCREPAKRP